MGKKQRKKRRGRNEMWEKTEENGKTGRNKTLGVFILTTSLKRNHVVLAFTSF